MAGARDGILSAIGQTPLIRLHRLCAGADFEVYAKLEFLNPGGSIKDRSALRIVEQAIASGRIRPGKWVIESSSGNMAIGLAQVCRYHGVPFCCVVDPKTTAMNVKLLKCYGAEVELVTEPDPVTGEYLPMRLRRVRELLEEHEGSFWPNQYANADNAQSQQRTVEEICCQLGREPAWLFCALSTCGTLRGCADWLRSRNSPCRIIGVDAVGSAISSNTRANRLIPVHGSAIKPDFFTVGLADRLVCISDLHCVCGCRLLLDREAILAGGSSGAQVAALFAVRPLIARGSQVVLIFSDRGERYLDTVFCDDWVERHFGTTEWTAIRNEMISASS